MAEDYKDRVRKAMEAHHAKQIKTPRPSRKPNQKPELELQAKMISRLEKIGFFVFSVESKSVWSQSAGRYLNSQTVLGCSDILGIDQNGSFVAVEVKAPGRRSTLRAAQRIFLDKIISRNGFAVCSDSLEHLEKTYQAWLNLDSHSQKDLLKKDLPKETKDALSSSNLFE